MPFMSIVKPNTTRDFMWTYDLYSVLQAFWFFSNSQLLQEVHIFFPDSGFAKLLSSAPRTHLDSTAEHVDANAIG